MNNTRFVILFLVRATAVYMLWLIFYDLWMLKVGWLDNFIIDNLVGFTKNILTILGYKLFVYEHTIGVDGSHGVYIGVPCSGVELMALFAGFVVIFKGNIVHKVWFIILGVVVIHFLNFLRVVSLTLIAHYHPEVLDFNHKYTFTIFLYIIVFFGWMIWVRYFSVNYKQKTDLVV